MRKTYEAWCSDCEAMTTHNKFDWTVQDTGSRILGCRKCGRLRSYNTASLPKGTVIERNRDDATETMVEEGRLFKDG